MTSIQGPYSNHPRTDTRKLQGAVPSKVYDTTFISRFPMHGAQDRIITSLFEWFLAQLNHLDVPHAFSIENEQTANHILNELRKLRINRPDESQPGGRTDCESPEQGTP